MYLFENIYYKSLLTSMLSGPKLCPFRSGSGKYKAIIRGLLCTYNKHLFTNYHACTFDSVVNLAIVEQHLFLYLKALTFRKFIRLMVNVCIIYITHTNRMERSSLADGLNKYIQNDSYMIYRHINLSS